MNEIPGPNTIEILEKRCIFELEESGIRVPKQYPVEKSFRTLSTDIPQFIDHTLLRENARKQEFEELCIDAKNWKVATVCIPSNRVHFAKTLLEGSSIGVCTVIGFPFGYANTDAKIAETKKAILDGASEIDMVAPIGFVKDGDWALVYKDIHAVIEAAAGIPVKVIFEVSELSLEEKVLLGFTACYAGASFLKTSTGFSTGGATLEDVHLMRHIAKEKIGVKASGGIRSIDSAKSFISAGADRIGTSNTGKILGFEKGGKTQY